MALWITVSFTKDSAGVPEILDTNNYYPFGLNHIGNTFSPFGSFYSYKYNGKGLQESGMYDFGARMYLSDLGRWGVIDPLAEGFRRFSPYHYAADNPVMFTDPDGMRNKPYEGGLEINVPDGSWWFAAAGGNFTSGYVENSWIGKRTGGGATPKTFGETQAYRDIMAYLTEGSPSFQFPKGQEEYYQKNYPAFYNFVKNQLPKMVGNANFMKALSSASGFSTEELTESFKYGKGMYLKVMDLPFGDAEYLPLGMTDSSAKNTSAIDTPLLNWFEKANRDTHSIEGLTNLIYMSAVVAHESSHWGDDIKRTVKYNDTGLSSNYGDVGNFFENRAFGGRMGSYSSGISAHIKNYVQNNFILLKSNPLILKLSHLSNSLLFKLSI